MSDIFKKAKPIWLKERSREMNLTVGFTAVFRYDKGTCFLNVTGSTLYRIFINGSFAGYGPARTAHEYYRVDELDITAKLHSGENIIYIEVAGYNVNSYYTLNQESFLQAEVLADGVAAAYTSVDGSFEAFEVYQRTQKIHRYSFQRTFSEAWSIDASYGKNYLCPPKIKHDVEEQLSKKYLKRRVPVPEYDVLSAAVKLSGGTAIGKNRRDSYWHNGMITTSGPLYLVFPEDELDVHIDREIEELDFEENDTDCIAVNPNQSFNMKAWSYKILGFDMNTSGFIGFKAKCSEPVLLYLVFDEMLTNGDVSFNRLNCVNAVKYELCPGSHNLMTLECYTLKYLKIVVQNGDCTISDVNITEYCTPVKEIKEYHTDNPRLNMIYDSAINTYRQNATDLFMDCPSRERAGWLCDSFFIGRVEHALTGKSTVEQAFLENFLLPERFEHLPEGVFPMCYPADHVDGNFIPNWTMWLVLELREYLQRTGDAEMVMAFKDKIYALFNYFEPFINEDGLLEGLEKWVFLEWSKANELTQDVNYPTNMLYACTLQAAGELYDDNELIMRANHIRSKVLKQSYDGQFFVDNAVRKNGKLELSGERTEVCQYYAFFTDTATPESHSKLWSTLVEDFGPNRKETGEYSEIWPANAFIGNYLRLDLLSRYGYDQKVLDNIEGYFHKMTEQTGTLWELDSSDASLNHGFASHVVYWMLKAQ